MHLWKLTQSDSFIRRETYSKAPAKDKENKMGMEWKKPIGQNLEREKLTSEDWNNK